MKNKLTPEAIAEALYKLRNAWLPGGATYDTAIAALEAIGRVRELAEKLRDWEGAPDPIGPLHGAGLVRGQNLAGEAILAAIDGEAKP